MPDTEFVRNLLSATGLVTVLACAALAPAQAQDRIVDQVVRGPDGRDGNAKVITANIPATAGGSGVPLDLTNPYTSSAAATHGTAVRLESIGGRGGSGDLVPFLASVPGAAGGAGGNVYLSQTGNLAGSGNQTTGTALLFAGSQGGNGGYAQHGPGKGGDAGMIDVSVTSGVNTAGDNFGAIWARSVGGNAGSGGTTSDRVAVDTGGRAGAVYVDIGLGANVSTTGTGAPAIIAESRGGTGAIRSGHTFYLDPFTTEGGSGGLVSFRNLASIRTDGAYSSAVVLQSLGGHGGDQPDAGGRPGAKAGDGGEINALQAGTIKTTGAYSFGIVAQSVGGTGGKGGGAVFSGGDGGAAGAGGQVTLLNSGPVSTSGAGAAAIVAQSVGGGNALAAFQSQPIVRIDPAGGGSGGDGGVFFVGSGGAGGTGGDGGVVSVTNTGTISTEGNSAYGILAQSIGGSGGAAGNAKAYGVSFALAVGGTGGGGGNGGEVTVSSQSPATPRPGAAPSVATTGGAASAILAQSIGGGGGAGGQATTGSGGLLASLAIAVGGDGGMGGNGGAVQVDNATRLSTLGDYAFGVQAQSIGGGGGNAGDASAKAYVASVQALPAVVGTVSLGGTGGGGGNGGAVGIDNSATVSTTGQQAPALGALSVGGGGGTAGGAAAQGSMLGLTANYGLGIAVGGRGGNGGKGGAVKIGNTGALSTMGEFSEGISAVSVGGGGGDGGSASATTSTGIRELGAVNSLAGLVVPYGPSVIADYAIGGQGGKGGDGGAVSVLNNGAVSTQGGNAAGLFGLSVGGGGGKGGGYSGSGSGTVSIKTQVGGLGGAGGNGGTVTMTNQADGVITTTAGGSSGLVAQSIGGGGGDGGSFVGEEKADSVILAGKSLAKIRKIDDSIKKAIDLKAVSAAKSAVNGLGRAYDWLTRTASDPNAKPGFIARQLDKLEGKITAPKTPKPGRPDLPNIGLTISVGGIGGVAGNGGVVNAINDGVILTGGAVADGIEALSIGGGGGAGGASYAAGDNLMNVSLSLGGTGAGGGKGGTVTVENTGTILTLGNLSYGILAQSIGGGGGVGGTAAGALTLSLSGTLRVGGSGGTASRGGDVEVTNNGLIATLGDEAHGIVAQSIGGGGGLAYVEGSPSLTTSELAQANGQAGNVSSDFLWTSPSLSVGASYGGKGGAGGDGGSIDITHSGAIVTAGKGAFGILAQSIGGGGGLGGNADVTPGLRAVADLGGTGGKGGDGGTVTVRLQDGSSIVTLGDGAIGVAAQSIGGGGGYAGLGIIPLVAEGGANGNGGAVNVGFGEGDVPASIVTLGRQAHGMYLQSLGAGGGLITDANGARAVPENISASRQGVVGAGGPITVWGTGTIIANGQDASAIVAQSGVQKRDGSLDPARKGGDIEIQWSGQLQGGSGSGVGVLLDGGATNTLALLPGSNVSALSGTAIQASFGNDTVFNAGTVTGNVNLDGGAPGESNRFLNLAGGLFAPGPLVALGARGALENAGTLEIAGAGTIGATKLTGSFVNTGKMTVDADFGAIQTDRLDASGSAQLGGAVTVRLLGLPERFDPANLPQLTILTAASIDSSGAQVMPTVVMTYGLTGSSGQTNLRLQNANFLPESVDALPAMTDGMRAVAGFYQAIWNAGDLGGQSAQIVRLAQYTDPQQYAAELQDAEGEQHAVPGATMLLSAQRFQDTLHSCPVFRGEGTLLDEQDCVYVRNVNTTAHFTGNSDNSGFRQTSVAFEAGGEKEVAPGWFLGGALSGGNRWTKSNDGDSTISSQTFDAGVVVKHFVTDRLLLAGSLSYGNESSSLTQVVNDISGEAVARANQVLNRVTGRLRAEYDIPFQGWYARPMLDLDLTYIRMPGYSENGAGFMDLSFKSADKVTPAVTPAIELGARVNAGKAVARLYADIGMTWFASPGWTQRSFFQGAPAEAGTFDTSFKLPSLFGRLTVGADVIAWRNLAVQAQYDGAYNRQYVQHSGTIRLDYRF